VRLAIKTLDGVRRLLNLLKTGDDAVVNYAALALSTVLQALHPLVASVGAEQVGLCKRGAAWAGRQTRLLRQPGMAAAARKGGGSQEGRRQPGMAAAARKGGGSQEGRRQPGRAPLVTRDGASQMPFQAPVRQMAPVRCELPFV
jgi:hypothetical protein